MQFKVRRILNKDIKGEIQKIGFSPSYLDLGHLKHDFLNIKIYDLKPEAATIIKQTALSAGCDAAVNKGVLNFSVEKTDIILSGSVKQLQNVAEKLSLQQFSMPKISEEIKKQINIYLNSKKSNKPKIMGILNLTEDSFSDGGKFLDPKCAIEHGLKMIGEGASIIDIGAESTRPGAKAIPSEIEIQRLTPVVRALKADATISIDTRNAETAREMALLGVDIINDVSGLAYDKKMAETIVETGLQVVITHSRGTPETMDALANYKNTVDEVYIELCNAVEKAINSGVQPDKIIIDPGFGFAKNIEQNFEILAKIEEFKSMGYPVLCGVSRKRFLKSLVDEGLQDKETLEALDNITSQASLYLAVKNIDFIRVHNVAKTKQALDLAAQLF